MARGSEIIVTSPARGRFHEGVINGTDKPGTVMQIDVSEGIGADGRFDWEAYNTAADGEQRLMAVLLPNQRGGLATEAYVTGDRCFLYTPIAGEELNMLILDITGTGDDHAFGEILIVNDGDGKLIATTGTPESEPFMLLEAVTDPIADSLLHCIYTGY